MKHKNYSERLLIEELAQMGNLTKRASKGLTVGSLLKMIRSQLGMSQTALAKRAGVPQSTISRIEKESSEANLSTVKKILDSIFCDLVVIPILREPVDTLRHKQARKQAERHLRYLKGTMSLEEQQPDSRFLDGLLKEEEERLLQGPDSELWGEYYAF